MVLPQCITYSTIWLKSKAQLIDKRGYHLVINKRVRLRVVESRVEVDMDSIIAAQCQCAFEVIHNLGTSRYLKRAALHNTLDPIKKIY